MNTIVKKALFWISVLAIPAIIVYSLSYFQLLVGVPVADLKAISSVIAQVSTTMLGFILATLAIIATISNSRLIKNLQKRGHYQLLLSRMYVCLVGFLVLAVLGVVVMFTQTIQVYYFYPLIYLGMFSLTLLIDVTTKFWTVLHNLKPDGDK